MKHARMFTNLNLSGNRISALPANTFDKLTKLESLHIFGNCLATEQEPLKTIFSTAKGTISKDVKPDPGCPQKTVSIVSISSTTLTTTHNADTGENVYLKTRIDGVAQADGDPIFATKGNVSSINQSLFVLSELHVELWAQATPTDLKIGEVTVPIAGYTPGAFETTVDGSGASYAININKR